MGGLEELLAKRMEAMRLCESVAIPIEGELNFWEDLAENVLYKFDSDELRLLVDFYFGCKVPFPAVWGAPLIPEKDASHYSRVVRTLGGVEDVNRLLFLDEKPETLKLLYMFVHEYNSLAQKSIGLEREPFSHEVQERGLNLFLEIKDWDINVLREAWFKDKASIPEISRGQRTADMAHAEKNKDFTEVHNYEKGAVRFVGKTKTDNVEKILEEYPDMGSYYALPESVFIHSLALLKDVHMVKALELRLPLIHVFSGSELELYLTLPKGNKIDCLYEGCLSKLAEYDEKDIAPAPEVFKEMRKELQESLIGTLYQSRLRPVMPLNGMFNGWMKIREMIPELYLGAGALRKRVKENVLNGVKIAQGKYVGLPKAGYWLVNPDSGERLKSRYGLLSLPPT